MSENFKEMAGDDIMDVFFDREEFGRCIRLMESL